MAVLTTLLALAASPGAEAAPLFEIVPVPAEYQNAPVSPPAPPVSVTQSVPVPPPPPPRPSPPSMPAPTKMLQPLNPGSWVTNDDYPPAALRGGMQGQVRFTLSVDEKGAVTDCTVTGSSGSQLLDETTCTLLKTRAKFAPAEDGRHRPIPALYSNRFRWEIPKSDLQPIVSWALEFRFTIGPEGEIVSCSKNSFGQTLINEGDACAEIAGIPRPLLKALRGITATGPVTLVARSSQTVADLPLVGAPALSAAFKPIFATTRRFEITPEGTLENCSVDIGNGEFPLSAVECAQGREYEPGPGRRKITVVNTMMTDGDPYVGEALEAFGRAGRP